MTALPEVLEKLVPREKVLPDLLLATYHESRGWSDCRQAMLALLREHGPALLRDAGDGERLRDLHSSIRRVYDITPMLPITAETMEGATEALTAFCMLVGIHKVDIGPYKPKDTAMHAPGGA